MKQNIYFSYLTILFGLIVITISFSCAKDSPNSKEIKNDSWAEKRTVGLIGTKPVSWVENFRLTILENRSNQYNPEDAIVGLDAILNLYKTNHVGNFDRYDINKKEYNLPINADGKVSTTSLRQLFETIHNDNKQFFLNSPINNKLLGGIALAIKERNFDNLKIEVFTQIGDNMENVDHENPDSEGNSDDDLRTCNPTFKASDCFVAGFGDADYTAGGFTRPLQGGGKCDGTFKGLTAAHEEVQKKFSRNIPNLVNIGGTTHSVKFVNTNCEVVRISRDVPLYNNFRNCSNEIFTDVAFGLYPTSYNSDKLDCAHCIINKMLSTKIPIGSSLSYMNISTELSPGGDNKVVWFVEICWGEPIYVPIVQNEDGPQNPDNDGMRGNITNDNPYLNLNIPVGNFLNH